MMPGDPNNRPHWWGWERTQTSSSHQTVLDYPSVDHPHVLRDQSAASDYVWSAYEAVGLRVMA